MFFVFFFFQTVLRPVVSYNSITTDLSLLRLQFYYARSSRPEVFCKKGVVRNFTKFTGKHLCQRLFFNKVADLRPATLLKKSLWYRCFPVNFVKFLTTPFFTEHLRRLLLLCQNKMCVLLGADLLQ